MMVSGMTDKEVISEIYDNNLFQYPTERMIRNIASVCLRRLHALESAEALAIVAEGSVSAAKQVCFYAMMLYYHLIWDFMSTVIAEKFRTKDFFY